MLYVCVIWCSVLFLGICNCPIFCFMRVRWEFSFFAWYVQIFYFCFMCGCWEFSVVCVVFTTNIFLLNTLLVSIYFSYCNFNITFCSLCVCNMMFNFFYVFAIILFVFYAWPLENFHFFAWYLQMFYLCFFCGCWEFSVVCVVFTANIFCLIRCMLLFIFFYSL